MKQNLSSQKYLVVWLLSGALLVAAMVVIGGITRLTQSGLSMVEWKLIMGAIPPTTQAEWQATFEKYQQFPEYQKLNLHYTLSDFKSIFWWEYTHRLLGRIIGVVFLVPFLYFLVTKKLDKPLISKLLFILFIGGFQGFLGWFMVKSGLVNNPHVSHYRLAAHLVTAFFLFAYIFNLALRLAKPFKSPVMVPFYKLMLYMFLVLLAMQIVFGAFVAGLKAGYFYPTFPTMGGEWLPDIIMVQRTSLGSLVWIDSIAGVQFVHRWLGVTVWSFTVVMGVLLYPSLTSFQRQAYRLLFGVVSLQASLGIATLLLGVPVWLAVLHQFGALLTLMAWVNARRVI